MCNFISIRGIKKSLKFKQKFLQEQNKIYRSAFIHLMINYLKNMAKTTELENQIIDNRKYIMI